MGKALSDRLSCTQTCLICIPFSFSFLAAQAFSIKHDCDVVLVFISTVNSYTLFSG